MKASFQSKFWLGKSAKLGQIAQIMTGALMFALVLLLSPAAYAAHLQRVRLLATKPLPAIQMHLISHAQSLLT